MTRRQVHRLTRKLERALNNVIGLDRVSLKDATRRLDKTLHLLQEISLDTEPQLAKMKHRLHTALHD